MINHHRADLFDTALFVIFMFGLATGIQIQLGAGLPLPFAIAGIAGLVMLLRRIGEIREVHIRGFFAVFLIYALSVMLAPDYDYLGERFKGLVQLTYSMVIGYGVFLTACSFEREKLSHLFLGASILIILGCALELNVQAFRDISDNFRQAVYATGVYASDLRDYILYGGVRPKLFTSEPSYIAFAYIFFSFCWYCLSRIPFKAVIFLVMLAPAYLLMRSPTLMLSLPAVGLYELLIATRKATPYGIRMQTGRMLFVGLLGIGGAFALVFLGLTVFAERIHDIANKGDPSFFFRIVGPFQLAMQVFQDYPLTGIGLTGEEFMDEKIWQIYFHSPFIELSQRVNPVNTVITNYFWLHWMYLGAVFGAIVPFVWSYWLRVLGVPSLLFCWGIWVLLGQSAGAYVSPRTWVILFLAAAIAVMHDVQQRVPMPAPQRPMPQPGFGPAMAYHREPVLDR